MKRAEGRDLLGDGSFTPAVLDYRERLLGRLGLEAGRGRWALDLGCGDGLEALWLAERGWRVEALDLEPHPRWKALARMARGRVRFRRADAEALHTLRGAYDLVFEKDMLHHVARPDLVLRQMRRLTRPGGMTVVLECNRRNPIFYLHLTLLRGHQHFTLARLGALLDGAGFQGWRLLRLEARVWPWVGAGVRRLLNRLQDALEAFPPWRPFVCYHAALWRRPKGKP